MAEYGHLLEAADKWACTDREVFERWRKTGILEAELELVPEKGEDCSQTSLKNDDTEDSHEPACGKQSVTSILLDTLPFSARHMSLITALGLLTLLPMELYLIYQACPSENHGLAKVTKLLGDV